MIFAGGLIIGGSLAVALSYTYAANLLENRSHSRRNKAIQRRVPPACSCAELHPSWCLILQCFILALHIGIIPIGCLCSSDGVWHGVSWCLSLQRAPSLTAWMLPVPRPSSPRRRRHHNNGEATPGDHFYTNGGKHLPEQARERRRASPEVHALLQKDS
jgi:hypothetical protein